MGFEYELRFANANKKYTSFNVNQPVTEAIDRVLCTAPGFLELTNDVYHFEVENGSAQARLTPDGIYLLLSTPAHETDVLFNHLVHRVLELYSGLEIAEL